MSNATNTYNKHIAGFLILGFLLYLITAYILTRGPVDPTMDLRNVYWICGFILYVLFSATHVFVCKKIMNVDDNPILNNVSVFIISPIITCLVIFIIINIFIPNGLLSVF